MHRSAAKRLLQYSIFSANRSAPIRIETTPPPLGHGFRFVSSGTPEPPPPPFSNDFNTGDTHHHHDSSHTDTTTTRNKPRANYQEEQARVLAASLQHVIRLGWSEAAMIAGARDVSVSPSIVGSIPRKEAALVEYFMDQCLQKLIDMLDSAPYISKWPQALSIQAQPSNISASFKQRAMLVDEFCHASNDEASGVDWYLKRSIVGGIYSSTEIYMLTDNSTDFEDTWVFLNERVRDAFDLKKTFQEVKYFAEAVGAGLGSSLQGFSKKSS